MKPVDPSAAVPVATNKTEVTDELKAALEMRLWQLLYAVPELRLPGNPDQVAKVLGAEALSGTGSSSQGHLRDRDERDRDASGALSSAAHLLAMTIPQLGVTRYEEASPHKPATVEGWTVQLGHVDADGGTASVNVPHPLLGDIALDVELAQSAVRVIATVPNDYGARILQEGQALLAERLRRQGVTLEVLEVIVRRKRKNKESQPPRSRRQRRQDR
ncbi:MAG TPA: hypothetical protein VMF89_27830 [Polyangiales bacterium]|nr:hypothetical protein [Polyangiales bacterium]